MTRTVTPDSPNTSPVSARPVRFEQGVIPTRHALPPLQQLSSREESERHAIVAIVERKPVAGIPPVRTDEGKAVRSAELAAVLPLPIKDASSTVVETPAAANACATNAPAMPPPTMATLVS